MGLTPVQRRMVTAIGAKQVHGDDFFECPEQALVFIAEALELLLLREIERAAQDDKVDIEDGLIELIQREGAAEMHAAAAQKTVMKKQ